MSPERRRSFFKLGLIFVVLGFFVFVVLLFDGDLDFGGYYQILQAVPSSQGKIAFEIERTDKQALSGPRYAIVITDHVPSTFELRRALISFWQRGNFELADPSVRITWSGPNLLTLTTDAPATSPDWLLNQAHRIGNVAIQYSGRP